MSMMDQITAALGMGGGVGGQNPQQQGAIAGLMKLLNNPQIGGISGLLAKLQSSGLGNAVSSWLGKGPNQPVTGEQIKSALGEQPIAEAAREAGVSPEQASDGLAKFLPGLVDKLSPDGQIPANLGTEEEGGGLSAMLGSLKEKLSAGPQQ
jgi:uncharacterized protein YidB (DUF937 family)